MTAFGVISDCLFILEGTSWIIAEGKNKNITYGFVLLVCMIPSIIGDYYFIRWLHNNNIQNRDRLPRAIILKMFTIFSLFLLQIVYYFYLKTDTFDDAA